jgi:glycosyltransferase involved in cell wall biosynthesis
MLARPAVAVITAVRNAEATLERTLASVARQTWKPLEHIVIDGASTDGTRAILERQGAAVRWMSEPDRSLYDAMNKGLAMVRDHDAYVLFLNADDTFHADDAIESVLRAAAGEDLIYGLLERFDEELDYRDIIGREVTSRDLVLGMRCHHQAMLTRARVFERVGGFDLRYRIAADYDWAVRAFLNGSVSKRFVPVVVSTMSRGGLSDRVYLRSVRERWLIVRRHYPLAELARYTAWTGIGDYLRYYTQQGLKRTGLLNRARDAKRRWRSTPLPPRSARG